MMKMKECSGRRHADGMKQHSVGKGVESLPHDYSDPGVEVLAMSLGVYKPHPSLSLSLSLSLLYFSLHTSTVIFFLRSSKNFLDHYCPCYRLTSFIKQPQQLPPTASYPTSSTSVIDVRRLATWSLQEFSVRRGGFAQSFSSMSSSRAKTYVMHLPSSSVAGTDCDPRLPRNNPDKPPSVSSTSHNTP